MVIKELEQQEHCDCDDAIGRQAVLDGLASIAKAKAKSDKQKSLMGRVIFFVEQVPSVTPQPKMGKWIYRKEEDSYRCSLCNFPCHKDYMGAIPTDYCAGCGAKMQEVKE